MRRLLLGLAVAATTLVPGVVKADDTQIADFIQTRLQTEQQQGRLRGFNVDMQVEQGTVWFKGTVSNAQQEMLILQTAQQAGHLGVVQVVDDIEVAASKSTVKPVAYQQPQQPQAAPTQPTYVGPASYAAPPARQEVIVDSGMGGMVSSEPLPFATCGDGGMAMGGMAMGGEPMPAGQAGMGVPSGAPNLPGYAWPGYAAHPNFGAVSYPKQYSASAWPYIGPFYPYPQVPLGWRKVSLEWDDGFWQLDFADKSRH
ncbi:BON domain-containing protein [Mariniblastus fucicola]|uniref:BON domain-containing protein n=1 Tax=Mariniblastus fucicola TaxID=980251 RepID=A0A5B9P9N7_9BACT|nr:BON domain-containing protein [Mariniblastus fucicola]QEG21662.1 hypothetical protein MFFC18_15200 [Mariniblastus fucicola]